MFHFLSFHIPAPLALAIVAAIAFLFGRQSRSGKSHGNGGTRRDVRRAQLVAEELEKIAWDLRKALVRHHTSVSRFRERVGKLNESQQEAAWRDLCKEAEEILRPTLRLAAQISHAQEELRQQSANLMSLTEVRTDPLTGVNNRRGLEETIGNQLALRNRYAARFSLAILDIDHFKQINDTQGHLYGDQVLQQLARMIDDTIRETDVVARFGGEEFVVIMPATEAEGACILADRLRVNVAHTMPLTISIGVAEAMEGDSQESLLARADAALYTAKSAGRNCVYRHNGESSEPVKPEMFDAEPVA
jgi:diguanylate cyclase (GGDEF)-like protein